VEAADEAARVRGNNSTLPHDRRSPQHRHAVSHALHLLPTAAASSIVEEASTSGGRRQARGGGEGSQHLSGLGEWLVDLDFWSGRPGGLLVYLGFP
jgi:hypothetical protein